MKALLVKIANWVAEAFIVDAEPWIKHYYTCDNCGACCREQCSPPFDLPGEPDADIDRLPADVRAYYEHGMHRRKQQHFMDCVPCFWLTAERKCKHYGHRPDICRNLKVGGEACLAWREEYGLPDSACNPQV